MLKRGKSITKSIMNTMDNILRDKVCHLQSCQTRVSTRRVVEVIRRNSGPSISNSTNNTISNTNSTINSKCKSNEEKRSHRPYRPVCIFNISLLFLFDKAISCLTLSLTPLFEKVRSNSFNTLPHFYLWHYTK